MNVMAIAGLAFLVVVVPLAVLQGRWLRRRSEGLAAAELAAAEQRSGDRA